MNINNLFKKAFLISLFFVITGTMMKINKIDFASIFFIVGIILTFMYMIIGISEISNSNRISGKSKALWVLGFILFNFFTGLFYLIERKEIV